MKVTLLNKIFILTIVIAILPFRAESNQNISDSSFVFIENKDLEIIDGFIRIIQGNYRIFLYHKLEKGSSFTVDDDYEEWIIFKIPNDSNFFKITECNIQKCNVIWIWLCYCEFSVGEEVYVKHGKIEGYKKNRNLWILDIEIENILKSRKFDKKAMIYEKVEQIPFKIPGIIEDIPPDTLSKELIICKNNSPLSYDIKH